MIVRLYRNTDLFGVRDLFIERSLMFDEELFAWKKRAPLTFSWVGEHEGRIVAHYSIIVQPLLPGYVCGFAVDAIVSSTHGQVRYIKQLIDTALEQAGHEGIQIVVGFANEKMAPVKRFLGWKQVGSYSWQTSDGLVIANEPIGLNHGLDTYEQWRYLGCPREYSACYEAGKLMGGFSSVGDAAPMLVKHDSEQWNLLVNEYRFRYLKRFEAEIKEGGIIEPLYYPLISVNDIQWPVVWPLETVEGVTLGW